MKFKLALALTPLLFACNSKPKGFCDCLEKSRALNAVSNQILLGNDTQDKAHELIELRKEQTQACKAFELTPGPEMLKWKKECEKD